jgi:hypothetical protein
MKMKLGVIAVVSACLASASQAAVLFTENFESDVSANWTTTAGPGTNVATFGYDYSVLGIPSPTGSGSTLGLRLQANTTGVTTAQAITGLSTSPNGQSFTGDYVVRFHAWQNYGGTGTTMMNTYTIGATGATSQRPGGTIEGVLFASTSDGGSAADYRAYGPGNLGVQITSAGTYAAGSQNNSAAYYATVFPGGATSPAVQGPVQTSPAGTPAFTWQLVEITKLGDIVTWEVNDKLIATVNLSQQAALVGSNIALGESDINNSGPSDANLVFGLIDNLVIETIPEPTSLSAVALGGLLVARRRK